MYYFLFSFVIITMGWDNVILVPSIAGMQCDCSPLHALQAYCGTWYRHALCISINYSYLPHGRDFFPKTPTPLEIPINPHTVISLKFWPLRPSHGHWPPGISNLFCGRVWTFSGTTRAFVAVVLLHTLWACGTRRFCRGEGRGGYAQQF